MSNPSNWEPLRYSETRSFSHESPETELRDLSPSNTILRGSIPSSGRIHDAWETGPSKPGLTPVYEQVSTQEYQQLNKGTTRTPRSSRLLNNPWKTEVLKLLIGLAVLIAIAVLLRVYNGQKQPEWIYSFNLSTAVAVLSTLFRGTLISIVEELISQLKWSWFQTPRPLAHLSIFDQATRGPWGSLTFLLRAPRPNLSTVGALITILSLATSAFNQQAVRSVPCSKPVPDSTAFIPIAQTVNNNSVLFSLYGTDESRPGYDATVHVDRQMKAVFISGLSEPDVIEPPRTTCGTGNCTFSERSGISYSSLGVSSRCVDVSSKITQVDSAGNRTYELPGGLSLSYCDSCSLRSNVTLPNGTYTAVDIRGRWSTLFNATVEQYDHTPEKFEDIVVAGLDLSNAGPGFMTAFGHVSMMIPTRRSDQPTLNVTSLPEDFGLMAAVCWLYPSIINFQGQISNGQLIEAQVGDASPLALSSPYDSGEIFYRALAYEFQDPCYVNGSQYDNITNHDEVATVDIHDYLSNATVTGPKQCLYGLGASYFIGIQQMMGQVFTEDQCVPTLDYASIMCDSWWLGSFWNGRNATLKSVSAVMDGAAKSLTNRIRTIGEDYDRNPTSANGVATQLYVCTSFSWPWLLFPAAIFIGTAALLILMLIKSFIDGGSTPTWKSSLLPLLFYGLEEQAKRQDLMEASQLDELAEGLEVSLRMTTDGPRFVPGNTDRESSERNLVVQE